jgi:hypothetical protein
MLPESYRHSGQAPIGGLVISMIGTIVCSLILGVVYAFAVSWIPVVQLSLLATLGFGAAIGGIAGIGARVGKIRNSAVIPFFSVIGAVLGLWMAWVFDAKARFGISEFPLLINPAMLLGYLKQFHEVGFWSMGKDGHAVSGIFLLIIWATEALVIIGLSFVVARTIVGSLPFCETCEAWTSRIEAFVRFKLPEDIAGLFQQFSEGDLSSLNKLEPCVGDQHGSIKLDVCRCATCEDSSYLTLNAVQVSTNKNGETAVQLVPVVLNGKLSSDEMKQLQTLRDRVFTEATA